MWELWVKSEGFKCEVFEVEPGNGAVRIIKAHKIEGEENGVVNFAGDKGLKITLYVCDSPVEGACPSLLLTIRSHACHAPS